MKKRKSLFCWNISCKGFISSHFSDFGKCSFYLWLSLIISSWTVSQWEKNVKLLHRLRLLKNTQNLAIHESETASIAKCPDSSFLPQGSDSAHPVHLLSPGPASPGGQRVGTAREGESGGTRQRRGGRERRLRNQASWVWTPGLPLNWWDDLGSSSSPRTQWSQLWNGPITPSTSGHCVQDPVSSYVLSAQDRACPTSFLGIQCV